MGGEVVLIMDPQTPKPPSNKTTIQKPGVKPASATGPTPASGKPAVPPAAAKGAPAAKVPVKPTKPMPSKIPSLLRDIAPTQNMVINEQVEIAKYKRLTGMVKTQAVIIGVLVCVIILGAPVVQVVYKYHAVNPRHDVQNLVPLVGPNLTNDALISWATKSVVEIMTLGFGDFDRQILSQYDRFTPEGWESFTKAIRDMGLRDTFKDRQLVLTTVPYDAGVIVSQGINMDQEYEWTIELPIIMTYTTNNNVSEKDKAIAQLTIVRVPANDYPSGIAIKRWLLM